MRQVVNTAAALNEHLHARVPMHGMFRLTFEHRRHGHHVLYEFLDTRGGWKHRLWDDEAKDMGKWRPLPAGNINAVVRLVWQSLYNAGLLPEREQESDFRRRLGAQNGGF